MYRYSLLNTGENDYDNEFEHALTQGPLVYEDSTDDEVGCPGVSWCIPVGLSRLFSNM